MGGLIGSDKKATLIKALVEAWLNQMIMFLATSNIIIIVMDKVYHPNKIKWGYP